MSIEAKLIGRVFREAADRVVEQALPICERHIREQAKGSRSELAGMTPVGKTGRLRSGWQIKPIEGGVSVVNDVPYLRWQTQVKSTQKGKRSYDPIVPKLWPVNIDAADKAAKDIAPELAEQLALEIHKRAR